MPVLLYAACHGLIFTLNAGNIPYAHHLSCGCVAIDNLIGNLLLAILHCFDMDGYLLVVVADAATHCCDALCLESGEEHLLTYAVGLQALAVDVERYLLLLLTEEFHVGYRGDAAQSVTQVVAILFQFAVAALVALDGNEQSRGVAEVVVNYDSQHSRWQLRLESVQTMFDFTPYLILVVNIVIQLYHHNAHAVLRCGGGLFAVHLTVCKQIALQRASHLLLHLFAGSSRIYGYYHTLTDGGMREFIFRHHVHAVDTQNKQNHYYQ